MKSLKTALINIRRFPYQSFVVILLITLTFFLGYVFSYVMFGAEKVLTHFETVPQVIAFFKVDTEQLEIDDIASQMRDKPYVNSVDIVSKNQALEIYQSGHQDKPVLLELVTADMLPASIEVSGVDLSSLELIEGDLKGVEGIDEVVFQRDIVNIIERWISILRVSGIVMISSLFLVSFFLVIVTISLKAASKKRAISIMKIVGATRGYIVKPFMFEGLIYGFFSSLLGWSLAFCLLLFLTPSINHYFVEILSFPLSVELYFIQFGIGTATGLLFGIIASAVAVQRMIRK